MNPKKNLVGIRLEDQFVFKIYPKELSNQNQNRNYPY